MKVIYSKRALILIYDESEHIANSNISATGASTSPKQKINASGASTQTLPQMRTTTDKAK